MCSNVVEDMEGTEKAVIRLYFSEEVGVSYLRVCLLDIQLWEATFRIH